MDRAGFLAWRVAYEAAGVDPNDVPPAGLRALASEAGVIVSSDTPRAFQSARLLAPDVDVVASPLLRELDLVPPELGSIRLPLLGWALTFAPRVLTGAHLKPAEQERARSAADWLIELTETHGRVLAVTHASFRSELARTLAASGWKAERQGRSRHWSAWRVRQC